VHKNGFTKAMAKQLAIEVREELGVGVHEAFDPYVLADEYGVQVFTLDEIADGLGDVGDAVRHFTEFRASVFSAAVVPLGSGRVIVENPAHTVPRRRSTLAHEMSHVVLEHEFTTLLRTEGRCRESDREQEMQADELSGELLLPSDAALRLAYNGVCDDDVALRFDVSIEFARWRMNSTGARTRAQRAAARRRGT
jgi:Zn-dependent peptidase ImmA (M78 family)